MRRSSGLLVAFAVSAAGALAESPASQPEADLQPRPILTPEQRREAAVRVIDQFVAHVTGSPTIDASARNAVADAWQANRADPEPQDFIHAGLAIISPEYKKALAAMEEQNHEAADRILTPLATSADPYLSLHASAMLASSLVEQEKLEEADKILEPLAAAEKDLVERSFLEAEVDFLLGYCQLSNLKYAEAKKSLYRFELQHHDAPDRFRLPARQMYQELVARKPEGLGDVSDLMVYAGRRLSSGHPGKPVQVRQQEAVELLTRLIKQAEDREQQQKQSGGCKDCGGKGCPKCGKGGAPKGNWQPNAPANRSVLPEGSGQIGRIDRSAAARPGEEWGSMRPEERERVLQSLRRNFPSRYRQLVEQYYMQLGKEK